jgi:hypothetical protein
MSGGIQVGSPRGGRSGRSVFFQSAAALLVLLASGLVRADGIDVRGRSDAASKRVIVARDTVVGGLAGAVVSGGVLAYTYTRTAQRADWKPLLATGVGVGLLIGLAAGMIEANRYGHGESPRHTSDGLSFQEQHSNDKGGVFVAMLPSVRF